MGKPQLTFHKSAAKFILDAFPDMPRTCGICETDITEDNLGGVISKIGMICDNTCCLIEVAHRTQETEGQ